MRAARNNISVVLIVVLLMGCASSREVNQEWISLFNGQSLQGWNAGSQNQTFSAKDDKIVVHGPRDHLFYTGPVHNNFFKNFEFKAEVMTTEGSNSGIYFHTQFQDEGWPAQGYEVQINNSYDSDDIRTGSLYGIDNVMTPPVEDNEWFTVYIKVEGQQIVVKINDKTLVHYPSPEHAEKEELELPCGTFALQGHDPESKVYFKNIRIKPLK